MTTRRLLLTSMAMLCGAQATAHAEGDLGIGLMIGRPTGLTGEYYVSDSNSFDLAIGLDRVDNDRFYVHLDYLFYFSDLLSSGSVGLVPYLGPGGFIGGGDLFVGARVPFGLSLEFHSAPIKIFGELAPHLLFVPDVHLTLGGALGFRYFF